ncbi:MAG: GNAT family N-acetyltransferase [bacterium]
MTEAIIRKAGEADVPEISSLLLVLSRRYITPSFSSEGERKLLESMSSEKIHEYIESGYKYFVAEIDGRIVGAAAIKENRHLYHLFVAEDCQKQGLGRTLWEEAKSDALKQGNAGAFTVNSSPNAAKFYERIGFVVEGDSVTASGITHVPMRYKESAVNRNWIL